jgi:hypothetical protein
VRYPFTPPRSSESQHRTDDLSVMGGALWPTELSRHGWPPRDRTARYLRIRQAPSTSWVVASGCGRSRTCKAEARPGSSRVPSPDRIAHPRAERARVELARPKLNCFRGSSRRRSGCLSMAEDGVLETHSRFPGGDRTLAASSSVDRTGVEPAYARWGSAPARPVSRRAENSNPTALPAHSLAARPGPWPVHSPYPSRDSDPDVILLRDAALPVGLEGRALRAADRHRTGDLQLGKLALRPAELQPRGACPEN